MALILGETKPKVLWPGMIAPDDAKAGLIPSTDRREGWIPPSEVDGVVTVQPDAGRIDRLRKHLRDYVDLKSDEINERREANKYYHGKQWTDAELKDLEARGQPPIVYNRIARKVNGVVGLLERLRQDPKAYPRTPAHEQGADVATQCLRYALDASEWESQLSEVAQDLAVGGIGGWELSLEPTDDESQDPILARVPPETFFYDPRSVRPDFADARFMGVAKWMARDEVLAFLPDQKDLIEQSLSELSSSTYAEALDPDKENLWFDHEVKKLRVVEVWYREGDKWLFSIHTGFTELMSGESPFFDGKGKSACRFVMTSANVDEKGNRYGLCFRNLKGAQDEVNHRRSKGLHAFNTKGLLVEEGAVDDVNKLREEINRVDPIIALPGGQSGKLKIIENTTLATANLQMLQDAKEEIENFGPNPALIGQGLDNKSGRAIALLQQAAIAELGPFIVRVRAMKLRCYTLTWEAIRRNWTTARYIRLTDDEGVAGFLGINQPRTDPFGNVIGIENPIGKVMVDFVLDEGPDTVTLREDAQQALGQAMSSAGAVLPPPVMIELARALVSSMNLPPNDKKRITGAFDQLMQPEQPDPMVQELQVRGATAEIRQKEATAADKEASATLKQQQAQGTARQNAMNQLSDQIAIQGAASMMPAGF